MNRRNFNGQNVNRRIVLAAVSALALVTTACGSGADEAGDTLADTDLTAEAIFADVPERPSVSVGDASVLDDGPAHDAVAFESLELFSQSPLQGLELLGNGSAIVTFVQPGCDFSLDQSELLVDAATDDLDVTFVFIHSGGSSDAFLDFASDADLVQENMVHLDDAEGALSARFGIDAYPSTLLVDPAGQLSTSTGALNTDRLDRAMAIVSPTDA